MDGFFYCGDLTKVLWRNFLVFCALVRRNLKVALRSFWQDMTNYFIFIFLVAIIYGYIFPFIGTKVAFGASMFIGTIATMFRFGGYGRGMELVADLQFNKFFDYQIALPTTKIWVVASCIVSLFIELSYKVFLTLLFGKLVLGGRLDFSFFHLTNFLVIFFLGALMFATLLVFLIFFCSFHWWILSIWSRVFVPLEFLGCAFFPWSDLHVHFPRIAMVVLCNPFTYLVEGLRGSILGSSPFSTSTCAFALIIFSFLNVLGIWYALRYRHDYV